MISIVYFGHAYQFAGLVLYYSMIWHQTLYTFLERPIIVFSFMLAFEAANLHCYDTTLTSPEKRTNEAICYVV
jgi:hypothetical protein